MKYATILLCLSVIMLVACTTPVDVSSNETTVDDHTIEMQEHGDVSGIMVDDDGRKYLVNPDKIRRGIGALGDIRDRIPPIDDPKFVSIEDADEWIEDNELVLALEYNDVKRVYPLQVLVWHEIVNDNVGGDPVLVTYCPLCGSGIAYNPAINGETFDFGTSGKLLDSNLVMYDRPTNTYWTQIDGLAIVGELTGTELEPISIDTVVWRDWKAAHPDSEVLSKDTGHNRRYGNDPYGSYYEDSNLFFPVENSDDRIHAKDVVFGVKLGDQAVAFREKDLLSNDGELMIQVNGTKLKATRDDVGVVKVFNEDTSDEIVKERDFWFAWYAFHPNTVLWEEQ